MLEAKLVIVGGDAKAGEVSLELPTSIGRGKEADLTIPHALVSRTHSELFERDGKLWVKDLGSLNGTFVDNQRIESEQLIEPNQLLTLGNITFRAVYDIDQSSQRTLPSTRLPDSLQTIKIDPIATKQPASDVTLQNDIEDEETKVAPAAKSKSAEHAEPAPVFEEQRLGPRSAISEIDSFDPDEIGSLDCGIEQNESVDISSAQVLAPKVDRPDKPSKPVTPRPATKATSLPKKSPAPQPAPAPQEVAIDLGITDDASLTPLNSANINLDLPDTVSTSPVSFVGQIQTGETNAPSVIEDFQIDIGSDDDSEADVDPVRFDSFLKKLPK